MKLVKKDCGIHSGMQPGKCSKCPYLNAQHAEHRRKGYLQYDGTPWVAVLGEAVLGSIPPKPIA